MQDARVMLGTADDEPDGSILYGTWEMLPWGMHDQCFCITLYDTNQTLHVWLKGVTDREPPEREKNPRIHLRS